MLKACLIICLLLATRQSHASESVRLSQVQQLGQLRMKSVGAIGVDKNGTQVSLQWRLENDLGATAYVYLHVPSADSIIVHAGYQSADTSIITGPFVSAIRWAFPENPGIVPLRITTGKATNIHVRLWSAPGRPFSTQNIYLQSSEFTFGQSLDAYRASTGRTEFNGFFLGAVVFAMLFFLLMWTRGRQRVFLYYSLYLLGAAVYSLVVKTLPFSYLAKVAYLDYPLTYKLGEPVQYLFFGAYLAFAVELLDIDSRYKWLRYFVRGFMCLLAAAGAGLLIFNVVYFDYLLQQRAFVISRLTILPVALVLLVWIIYQVQSPVKWFFVAGSSFFFIGGLLAVLVDPKSRHLFFGVTGLNPVNFFKTGILLECLCFALALGYKIRIQQRERDQAASAYMAQLEVNRQLVESENQRLERAVMQRSQEILEKNLLLEHQKQAQMQSELQKQVAEMEMRALRSQMNPHFIFNSLNSIRYQIMKKDYDQAVSYLTRFSKLLRYILQNSREHVVTLGEEILMNELYVQLESLRFSQGFQFILQIPDSIDTSDILVPPMLLQPYIENAVRHGLVPSRKPVKKLCIQVAESENGYQIVIEDNGVGRASKPALMSLDGKQSLGMKISAERIQLFNQGYHPAIEVFIQDLFENDLPVGTRVLFNYKHA